MNSTWKVSDAMLHLKKIHPKFEDIMIKYGIPSIYQDAKNYPATINISKCDNPLKHYHALVKIIVYQQLSASSAEPIFQRFLSSLKLKTDDIITPQLVKDARTEIIYIENKKKISVNGVICGLSESKLKYIQDLSDHYLDKSKLLDINLHDLSDEDLRIKLTAVKGLGLWSVDMFMIFQLYRSNVLPIGDLGVRKGLAIFSNYSNGYFEIKKNQMLIPELYKNWAPYSSLATLYMWKLISKD